jgi:opacity protein-like surface antigen
MRKLSLYAIAALISAGSAFAAREEFRNYYECIDARDNAYCEEKFGAQKEDSTRSNYAGIRIYKSMQTHFASTESGTPYNVERNAEPIGVGVIAGFGINKYITFEGEYAIHGSAEFSSTSGALKETYSSAAIMGNAIFGYEFESVGIKPYAGVGIGFAFNSYDFNLFINSSNYERSSVSDTSLSYQVMVGAVVGLGERFALNFGLKYQDYGSVSKKESLWTYELNT